MGDKNQLPRSRKELAVKYRVSVKTLNKWLKREGLMIPNNYLTPKEISFIYEKLGPPNEGITPGNGPNNDNPEKTN